MNPQEKNKSKSRKRRIIIALAIIACLVIIDITFSGYMRFGYYYVKCGGMPVKVAVNPLYSNASYKMPGYYHPGGAINSYYCTEQEAIDADLEEHMYDRDHSRQRAP